MYEIPLYGDVAELRLTLLAAEIAVRGQQVCLLGEPCFDCERRDNRTQPDWTRRDVFDDSHGRARADDPKE